MKRHSQIGNVAETGYAPTTPIGQQETRGRGLDGFWTNHGKARLVNRSLICWHCWDCTLLLDAFHHPGRFLDWCQPWDIDQTTAAMWLQRGEPCWDWRRRNCWVAGCWVGAHRFVDVEFWPGQKFRRWTCGVIRIGCTCSATKIKMVRF